MPSLNDIKEWEEKLRRKELLPASAMKHLCLLASDVLLAEGNIRTVHSPAAICGDIHGQFADLLELFRVGGELSDNPDLTYVFLGDFVDRGYSSIQTFAYLMLLKIKYPERLVLVRGNHESRQVTTVYGFYDECQKKYGGADVWRACTEVFDCLPIAAIIDDEMLCLHGGLSPAIRRLDQIRLIRRKREVPVDGPYCDLLWSDPDAASGFVVSPRGAGYLYGGDVTREFMHLNKLSLIARAHQLTYTGYKYHFDEQGLVTMWSAPNYCYRCGNLAAILRLFPDKSRQFVLFHEVEDQDSTSSVMPVYFM